MYIMNILYRIYDIMFRYMNIAGANLATAWTHDLGGFYGQVPYSECPPGDPGYTKKCDPAQGGDPFRSGCNVNSCQPGGE
jgi:hypothetical protein